MSKAQGVSKDTARKAIERDGEQCVARITHPGKARRGEQIHHRKPRRMGGTTNPVTNAPANLIYLCLACHAFIESHPGKGWENGWILHDQEVPAETPIWYLGSWAMLDDEGQVRVLPPGVSLGPA